MGGESKQQQQTQQSSTTNPWEPAIAPLKGILGQLGAQSNNTGPTATETGALNQLQSNYAAGNPYAGKIGGVANDLLSGGPDRSGVATDAYNTYKGQLMPWANGSMGDPANNPALRQMLDVINNDVTNSVNGQFAAAGRDMSGANQMAYGRGIAQGYAPVLMQAQQMGLGAANDLYNGGNTTTGILAGLDQQRLGNQQAGIGVAGDALDAQNYGPQGILATEAARRGMPVQNIASIAGILGPLAGLGGTSSGTGTSNTTNQMSGAQQFAMLGNGAANWGKFLFG